jgi:fluoroquinolone transport system permease protein
MNSFIQFLNQIVRDAMLILICGAPILCGLFFFYGIPFIQSLLVEYLSMPNLLPPYYLLFDLFLGAVTPLLFCFAAAYVILGEIDDGISKYLAVTPIGKKGYLVSRIGIPAMIAFVISIIVHRIFGLTDLPLGVIIIIAFMMSLLGLMEALLVVAISSNKVEGMAMSKLSGFLLLGLPVPFFLTGNIQYLLFPLPSFWVAKYVMERQMLFAVIGIITSLGWILLLYQKFKKKVM